MKLLNALMKLYPREWRARYEEEFIALIEQNPLSLIDLGDIALGALDARLRPQIAAAQVKGERGPFMKRALFTKWSGMAGMLGSVLMLLGFVATSTFSNDEYPSTYDGLDITAFLTFFVGIVLIAIFLVGIAGIHGRKVGLIGQIGVLLAFVGLLSLGFSSIRHLVELTGGGETGWWEFFIYGLMGLLVGVAIFCLAGSVQKSPPSVGSKLTMFAGFSALATLALSMLFLSSTSSDFIRAAFITFYLATLMAFTAGLFLLGYALWRERGTGLARIEPATIG